MNKRADGTRWDPCTTVSSKYFQHRSSNRLLKALFTIMFCIIMLFPLVFIDFGNLVTHFYAFYIRIFFISNYKLFFRTYRQEVFKD